MILGRVILVFLALPSCTAPKSTSNRTGTSIHVVSAHAENALLQQQLAKAKEARDRENGHMTMTREALAALYPVVFSVEALPVGSPYESNGSNLFKSWTHKQRDHQVRYNVRFSNSLPFSIRGTYRITASIISVTKMHTTGSDLQGQHDFPNADRVLESKEIEFVLHGQDDQATGEVVVPSLIAVGSQTIGGMVKEASVANGPSQFIMFIESITPAN